MKCNISPCSILTGKKCIVLVGWLGFFPLSRYTACSKTSTKCPRAEMAVPEFLLCSECMSQQNIFSLSIINIYLCKNISLTSIFFVQLPDMLRHLSLAYFFSVFFSFYFFVSHDTFESNYIYSDYEFMKNSVKLQ